MSIRKTPLAMAVVALLAAPTAMAQSVTVYGKLYPYLLSEDGAGGRSASSAS